MVRRIVLVVAAFGAASLVAGTLWATIIVDPPQPLTKQVSVQLIQTALDNGTSPATVFGDASQRANIETSIESIWAQAGIDLTILPTINRYNNTFAYRGNNGSGTRSIGDLNTIFTNAGNAGVLHPQSSVLNLIMVDVVPAFPPLDEDTAAGYARVVGNGMTGFVGSSLLTFQNGLDAIASVFAHEIGHNLGLNHTADQTANLMSPGGTSQQLTQAQITMTRNSTFALPITQQIAGDYNLNGTVDAADYVLWRATLDQTGSNLPADGNNSGRVESGDFTLWQNNFGMPSGGSAAVGDSIRLVNSGISAVPEAYTLVSVLTALPLFLAMRRRTIC